MSARVALITGGARGIGRAVALSLAEQQWSVAICYRASRQQAEETVSDLGARGARGMAERCDVADPAAAAAFAAHVESTWGRIDALINCAGPYHRVPLLEESVDGWRAMFDNNLHPVFYLSRAVARGMMERRWGRIVNFSMANADQLVAQPQVTAHYIAKAGVLVLTRSLARALGPHGVTVNAIAPVALTRMTQDLAMFKGMTPEQIGPQYIAPVAAFLASDLAADVTGQILGVHGPKIFLYRMTENEGVTKDGGPWSPVEIKERWGEIAK